MMVKSHQQMLIEFQDNLLIMWKERAYKTKLSLEDEEEWGKQTKFKGNFDQ